jgi:brefeldin A-inhibited guanine nucleotide-exchange protein
VQVSAEPSDDTIRRTLDHLHDVAKGATYFSAMEPDTVRPMLELIWAPLLGCFSLLFDEYADPRLLAICLSGFAASACLAAELGVTNLRDVFVNSLCNFTHLHSPATMKPKNGLAFKYLLKVAVEVGNNLGERWLEVLRCISRWELLQQIASGMPTDAVLFAAPNEKGLGKAAAALKDQLRKLSNVHGLDAGISGGVKSMESMAMSEVSIKKAHIGASGREEEHVIPQDIINSVDTAELNKVYMRSSALDSDAIVHFVRALAAISLDELQDPTAPRVFSLTKIVEISHFNMTRIR